MLYRGVILFLLQGRLYDLLAVHRVAVLYLYCLLAVFPEFLHDFHDPRTVVRAFSFDAGQLIFELFYHV